MPTNVNYTFIHNNGAPATAVAVSFVPASSGNTTNLNSYVIDPNGATWYIDQDGNAIKVEHKAATIASVDAPFNWNLATQSGNVPKAAKIFIAGSGKNFEFRSGDGTPPEVYNPPFVATTDFDDAQLVQDVAHTTLANTERAWAKAGDLQATNAEAVLVSDDIHHTGKVKVGLNADDGTGRQLQVAGGVSVTGLSKYSNVFSGRIPSTSPSQYVKLFEISGDYSGICLEITMGTYISTNKEVFLINYTPTYGILVNSVKRDYSAFYNFSIIVTEDSPGFFSLYVLTPASYSNIIYNIYYSGDYTGASTPNFNPILTAIPPINVVYDSSLDFNSMILKVPYSGIANPIKVGINKDPTEALDVNGNVQGNTARFFSYVTLSDGKAKDILGTISAEQAQRFVELFPDAITYKYKDDYAPDGIKDKLFVGFDAMEVEKVQLANPKVFVPLTTKKHIDCFDENGLECAEIEGALFGQTIEQFESQDAFEAAKSAWEAGQQNKRAAYEKRKCEHLDYKQKYEDIRYLDQASLLPMVLMQVKELTKQVKFLQKEVEVLKGGVKKNKVK